MRFPRRKWRAHLGLGVVRPYWTKTGAEDAVRRREHAALYLYARGGLTFDDVLAIVADLKVSQIS